MAATRTLRFGIQAGATDVPYIERRDYWREAERLGAITPATIGAAPLDDIQRCGLSWQKASYIMGLSDAVIEGAFDLDALPSLPVCWVISAAFAALMLLAAWRIAASRTAGDLK